MNNPFLKDGAITPNASINNVYIKKMSVDSIKENLEEKLAGDIFSTAIIISEIKKHSKELKLDLNKLEEKKLPQYLSESLESIDKNVKKQAEEIAELFGNRLAMILLVLKTGLIENRNNRKDWTNDYWDYWKQIENVILTGGLAGGNLGVRFKYYINKLFIENNIKPYNIILNSDSENIAIKGCSTYIKNPETDKNYLILDCGATFIKRCSVKFDNNGNINITKLNKVPSKYVEWTYDSQEEEAEEAAKMHSHIMNTIIHSINDIYIAEKTSPSIGDIIVISIANYVKQGSFIKRGAYGKLRLLCDNYEMYLSDKLYEVTEKRYNIKLVHDGTAMASAFNSYDNSVCISLGTHFGVGFPMKTK